jgi:SAM-dependent methyltransferase
MPGSISNALTALEYQILRRIAPREPTHMDGSAYAHRSKLAVLLGETFLEQLAGKTVVDFGCGEGREAIEMARAGASVIGIDIQPEALERARANARAAGVADRCRFASVLTEPVDLVVSLDSFEHFADPLAILGIMYDMLRPGGAVVSSFGPTWYHPYGGHLFSVSPWAHLVFSESALIRWRSDIRSDGATRFSEVAGGLNRMTIGRFLDLVRQTPFCVETLEFVPIRRLAKLHNRATRELTTAIVRCRLLRAAGLQPPAREVTARDTVFAR